MHVETIVKSWQARYGHNIEEYKEMEGGGVIVKQTLPGREQCITALSRKYRMGTRVDEAYLDPPFGIGAPMFVHLVHRDQRIPPIYIAVGAPYGRPSG